MEQVTESVKRDSKVDCCSSSSHMGGDRLSDMSAGVRNRENEMENNRVSDGDVEMKIDGEVEIQRHEASE
ncbi:hypothetical protein Bca4012_040184 [Brassica carinata]